MHNQQPPKHPALTALSTALCLSLAFGYSTELKANNEKSSLLHTQQQLKKLDEKIKTLQQHLAQATNKRSLLNDELSYTEKKIGQNILKLHQLEADTQINRQKISELEMQAKTLKKQLNSQQQLLSQHVRSRYQIGEYQPLKWLLNQDDPYTVNRLLSYYQYIVRSRLKLMDGIALTQKDIQSNQGRLQQELAEKNQLQTKLTAEKNQLIENKQFHKTLINSLDNEIENKQLTLKDYQRNKDNLSQLLKNLVAESRSKNEKPFHQMLHKLPFPIQTKRHTVEEINQGAMFFAREGTPVIAVYPGKIVFSDWLKGYGLLLIIDHGQGYMTLYAHNESIFKRKGEHVTQNEQIASVGHSGGIKQNGLYFEIRHQGKAVSPLKWLS